MSEQQSTTVDSAGVTRTQDSQIAPAVAENEQSETTSASNQTSQTTEQNQSQESKSTTWLTNKDDEGKGEAEAKTETKDEAAAKPGAPEKYEPFKLPEGSTIDKPLMDKAEATFKELGLSQEQGQKLMDLYGEQIKSVQAALNAPVETYLKLRSDWKNEIANSQDIGPRQKEVKAVIGKAIASLDPKTAAAFNEAVNFTGVGDNLGFVRAMYEISQLITEGGFVRGRGPAENGQRPSGQGGQPTAAQAMYPNLKSTQG